eukprot:PhF_6_TR25452/c0_g1_i13/m.35213
MSYWSIVFLSLVWNCYFVTPTFAFNIRELSETFDPSSSCSEKSYRPYGSANVTVYLCAILKSDMNDVELLGSLLSLVSNTKNNHKISTQALYNLMVQRMGGSNADDVTPIREWDYLGPFLYGKTEYDGDPLASVGGPMGLWNRRLNAGRKGTRSVIPSELSVKSELSWRKLQPYQNSISVQHKQLGQMVQSLGDMGIMEFVGYAFANVVVKTQGVYVIRSQGIHTFFIDDVAYSGDQFGRSYETSVVLSPGTHCVHVRLRGVGSAQFTMEWVGLVKDATPWSIPSAPQFLPDVVFHPQSEVYTSFYNNVAWLSIPISSSSPNTITGIAVDLGKDSKRTSGLRVIPLADVETPKSMKNGEEDDDAEYDRFTANRQSAMGTFPILGERISPQQMTFIRVALQVADRKQVHSLCVKNGKIPIKLIVNSTASYTKSISVELRCRNVVKETFVMTFVDFDGSISHAAVRLPREMNLDDLTEGGGKRLFPVVLTLHGTGVSANNQADAYKVGGAGNSYIFGVEGCFVIAPDRHGAHNWEGVGKYSALAALFTVAEASLQHWSVLADKSRVVYKGHSMGGHGALILATQDPTRAIGVMLLAPWISKEHYGEANAIHQLDRSTAYLDGQTKGILEASVSDNAPDLQLVHLLSVPVFLRTGRDDHTVHPYFARRLYRMLKDAGHGNVTYSEPEGKEHWWWDSNKPNDGGCMNDEEIRNFLSKVVLLAASKTKKKNSFFVKGELTVVTVSPFTTLGAFHVSILEQKIAYTKSWVKVTEAGDVTTRNVKRMKFGPSFAAAINRIDGHVIVANDGTTRCYEKEKSSMWKQCTVNEYVCATKGTATCDSTGFPPRSRTAGTMKSHMERPNVIMIPSSSHQELHHAATFIANSHFVAYDTILNILVEGELQQQIVNHILVGVGSDMPTPMKHAANTLRVNLEHTSDCMEIQGRVFCGTNSSLAFATISPHNHLILYAQSREALHHLIYEIGMPTVPPMMRPPFGNMLPDIFVSDMKLKGMGYGSFVFGGYFDAQWQIDERQSFGA